MGVNERYRDSSPTYPTPYTRVMKDSAFVRLKDDKSEMQFEWLAFDGDDCFNDFHVNITSATGTRRFDFGACAIHGLRKLSKFFRDETQVSVSLGFQNPDIRCCDICRGDDGYRLIVRFEGSGLHEQFDVQSPMVQIDEEFLRLS